MITVCHIITRIIIIREEKFILKEDPMVKPLPPDLIMVSGVIPTMEDSETATGRTEISNLIADSGINARKHRLSKTTADSEITPRITLPIQTLITEDSEIIQDRRPSRIPTKIQIAEDLDKTIINKKTDS